MARLLYASELQGPPDWSFVAHRHDGWEVMVVLTGTYRSTTHQATFVARAGELVMHPPGMEHCDQGGPDRLRMFVIGLGADIAGGSRATPDLCGRVATLSSWLVQDHQRRNQSPGVNSLSAALVDELGRVADSSEASQIADSARAFLRAHLHEDIGLADVADHVGLSRSQLARTYRRSTGNTPIADLRRLRLERARELIASTRRPLASIAREVGLFDEFHLSRSFREAFGVTTSELRARIAGHADSTSAPQRVASPKKSPRPSGAT